MAGATVSIRAPKPFCLCGCGQRVRQVANKYASRACVPASVRAEAARKSRLAYAYRYRATAFRAEIDRLNAGGRRVTTEDLLALLMSVYRRGYSNGHQAFRIKGWKLKRKVAA